MELSTYRPCIMRNGVVKAEIVMVPDLPVILFYFFITEVLYFHHSIGNINSQLFDNGKAQKENNLFIMSSNPIKSCKEVSQLISG